MARTAAGYLLALLFIGGWWLLAFPTAHETTAPLKRTARGAEAAQQESDHSDRLVWALNGDAAAARTLLFQWDRYALLWQQRGVNGVDGVEQLPAATLLEAAVDACAIEQGLDTVDDTPQEPVYDDYGVNHEAIAVASGSLLPQTWSAAAMALSLVPADAVAALPAGIRRFKERFPRVDIDAIALDCDRYNSELLGCGAVQLALVANYTNPGTLETLKQQGIATYTISRLDRLDDIYNAIERIAALLCRPRRGRLLTALCRGCCRHVENRLAVLRSHGGMRWQRPLYLQHSYQWAIPTRQALVSELLQRLGLDSFIDHPLFMSNRTGWWLLPVTSEQIVAYDPDLLIIAADVNHQQETMLALQRPPLNNVTACRSGAVALLDGELQQEVSHYIILAYCKIIEALETLCRASSS